MGVMGDVGEERRRKERVWERENEVGENNLQPRSQALYSALAYFSSEYARTE